MVQTTLEEESFWETKKRIQFYKIKKSKISLIFYKKIKFVK